MIHVLAKLSGSRAGQVGLSIPISKLWSVGGGGVAKQLPTISFQHVA